MQQPDKDVLEQQKQAAAFLTRRPIPFEPKSEETLAAEAKAAAEEQARIEAEAYAHAAAGVTMPDGTVCAGLTPDGKNYIFTMPTDLDVTMAFNDAARAVNQLNAQKAFAHDDWQIPDFATLKVLQKNQNQGSLKGTFKTSANKYTSGPDHYLSSTEYKEDPSCIWTARFSDCYPIPNHKDDEDYSCRPVRLVEVKP